MITQYYILGCDDILYEVSQHPVYKQFRVCEMLKYNPNLIDKLGKICKISLNGNLREILQYMKVVKDKQIFPLNLQLLTTKETSMTGSWIYPDVEFVYNR